MFFSQRHRLNLKWPASKHVWALMLSVGLHGVVIMGVGQALRPAHTPPAPPEPPKAVAHIMMIEVPPPPPATTPPPPTRVQPTAHPPRPVAPAPQASPTPTPAPPDTVQPPPAHDRKPAFMDAPPAPTAQEWALASAYKLKNSKRYRHTWGQQVRSMMGTAFEGADQGVVRFRIEIAPDGRLLQLQTLWSTSAKAEQLARQAIQHMPPLPPTPTGQPLVFEKTISFQPFDADVPPLYKDDCLPDPPSYRNRFAWNGQSPQVPAPPPATPTPALDPEALAECMKQLPQDSVEAEAAHNQRQLEQWGADRLTRTEVPRTPQ